MISVCLSPPSLLLIAVLLGEAVPSGQLVYRIAEKRVVAITRMPWFTRVLDPPSEILHEMFEPKSVAINESPVEGFLYPDVQIAHAKNRNGALPADPDVALGLWPHLDERVAEEPACHCPIELSPHSDHGEGFAHACPNENSSAFGSRTMS